MEAAVDAARPIRVMGAARRYGQCVKVAIEEERRPALHSFQGANHVIAAACNLLLDDIKPESTELARGPLGNRALLARNARERNQPLTGFEDVFLV